ncbi:MAG: hypothetical protein AAF788_04885 [Pseudomonadota bacterium]
MFKQSIRAVAVLPIVLAACASQPEVEEVVEEEVVWTAESMMVGGRSVMTLADAQSASLIEARARTSAANGYAGDNKGNACYQEPVFMGVSGETIMESTTRRAEEWNYTVCNEAYRVPVIVEKNAATGQVSFTVGTGREAR